MVVEGYPRKRHCWSHNAVEFFNRYSVVSVCFHNGGMYVTINRQQVRMWNLLVATQRLRFVNQAASQVSFVPGRQARHVSTSPSSLREGRWGTGSSATVMGAYAV